MKVIIDIPDMIYNILNGDSSSALFLVSTEHKILIQLLYCCKNSLYIFEAGVAFCCAPGAADPGAGGNQESSGGRRPAAPVVPA